MELTKQQANVMAALKQGNDALKKAQQEVRVSPHGVIAQEPAHQLYRRLISPCGACTPYQVLYVTKGFAAKLLYALQLWFGACTSDCHAVT
jgi:hypothetical protein